MDRAARLKRLHFRSHHRGTKEADLLIGGFFDRLSAGWDDEALDWFETLLEEQDADIIGWIMGSLPVPERWQGAMMERMRRVDYVAVSR
jgi:antitoxin CptB